MHDPVSACARTYLPGKSHFLPRPPPHRYLGQTVNIYSRGKTYRQSRTIYPTMVEVLVIEGYATTYSLACHVMYI